MKPSSKELLFLSWFGILTTTIALAIYAYLGLFTRYMADDYCLLVNLSTPQNIFIASWNKYLFESNRFSNLFVLGFWEIFPNNIAFVPALHILLWLTGLTWLLYELNRLFGWHLKFLLLFLTAEFVILFTFYTAPNIFQVLYWRPGQVTYFTSLVLFSFVAAGLVKIINSPSAQSLKIYAPLFSILAFFIGGLSETIGVFHLSILLLALVFTYFYDKTPHRKTALTLLTALFVGAFMALLAMFLAPANALRINPENSSPSILQVLLRSLDFAYAFLHASFKSLPVPFIALFVIFVLLSYIVFTQRENKKLNPHFAWIFLLIPIITYGLIFATFAPSAYGQSYPVERVRFPAHFILNIAIILFSICTGYVLSYIQLPSFTKYFIFIIAFLALLYPLWMSRVPLQTYEFRRLWAKRWDERQNMIYTAINNGETDIFVPGLDGYEETKELENDPTFWTNKCAADYYGVNSVDVFSLEEENIYEYFSE